MGTSQDLGPTITSVIWFVIVMTTVAVLLRCYVRIFIQRRFAPDDYLVIVSQIFYYCFMYCSLQEMANGIGKHLMDILILEPEKLTVGLKYWWIAEIFFLLSVTTIKVCIAIFFCALCPPRYLRLAAIGGACCGIAAGIGTELFTIFGCKPVSFFWKRLTPGEQGSCLDPHESFVILQLLNVLDITADIILAVLPCIMVWNLKMSRVKKCGVSILLGLGGLAAIAAIVRAFYFKYMLLNVSDFTYTAWPVSVTSILEPGIAISVVCFAQLRPLMQQIFPKSFFTSTKARSADVVTIGRLGNSDAKKRTDSQKNILMSNLDGHNGQYHGLKDMSSVHVARDKDSYDPERRESVPP